MKWWKNSLMALMRVTILLTGVLVVIVLFYPGVITKYFQLYANRNYLAPLGLSATYDRFEGDVFRSLKFTGVRIASEDASFSMELGEVELDIDFMRLIRRDLSFDNLRISRMELDIPTASSSADYSFDLSALPWVSIKNLVIDDCRIYRGQERWIVSLSSELDLTGELLLRGPQINLLADKVSDTLFVRADEIKFSSDTLFYAGADLRYGKNIATSGGTIVVAPIIALDIQFETQRIAPISRIPDWLELNFAAGQILGRTDSLHLIADLGLRSQDTPLSRTHIDAIIMPGQIILKHAEFESGGELIKASGSYVSSEFLDVNASFSAATMRSFMPDVPDLKLSGDVHFKQDLSDEDHRRIALQISLDRLEYAGLEVNSIAGAVEVSGDQWTITDTVQVQYAGSNFDLWGTVNEVTGETDLEIYLSTENLAELSSVTGLPELTGRAEGQIWVSGSWQDPALMGALMLYDLKTGNASSGVSFIQFVLDSAVTNLNGRFSLSSGDLDLLGIRAEGAEAELSLNGNELTIDILRIYDGYDKLEVWGNASAGDTSRFVLDSLIITRNSEVLSSYELVFSVAGSELRLDSSLISVGGGLISISGSWASSTDYDLSAQIEHVQIERLYPLLNQPARQAGTLEMALNVRSRDGVRNAVGDLLAVNGKWGQIPYSRVRAAFKVADQTLEISKLDWHGLEGEVRIQGQLYYDNSDSASAGFLGTLDSLNLAGNFIEYQFHELQPWMPWRMETKGVMNGSFTANGAADNPTYIVDMAIIDPQFDLVKARNLTGRLHYSDHTLRFQDLEMISATGEYFGEGYIPANLDPGVERMAAIVDQPMFFAAHGNTSQLDFISTYFESVDSLLGDYDIEIEIVGPLNNLVRNGKIEVHDGRVELFVMENPITGLNGTIKLRDNQLMIENLTGSTPVASSGGFLNRIRSDMAGLLRITKDQVDSHLEISGTMDMTKFFTPDFDIALTGEHVYFSTPLKEVEAIGTANFAFVGKDTVEFTGTFTPDPGGLVIRTDLSGPEDYNVREPNEGTIIVYQIQIPFYTGARYRTMEVDAEVEGEITLTAIGNEEFRYAGTVDLVGGGFVYNGYDFDFDRGSVTFEPSTFNPQFSISASTLIDLIERKDDETYVTVENLVIMDISGTLEDPNLVIRVDSDNISHTQSDLLEILALGGGGGEVANLEATASAAGILTNLILQEIERDAMQGIGLDRLRIQGGGAAVAGQSNLRINLGYRLSPRLYIGLQADPAQVFDDYQYKVSYRIGRYMSLEGARDINSYQINYRLRYRY